MKYLIIYAHPDTASFNHAIMETISDELGKGKRDFEVRDLYGMKFNPILSRDDLTAIQNGAVPQDIKREQDHIRSADTLLFVFPIWWSSMPAMLKGYIDRVFSLKFAYDITTDGVIGLLKGKKAFIVSTTGASREDYDRMGAFEMMNMSMDTAIFRFSGMEVIGHKYFSSVPYVSEEDRKQMLEELRLLVRDTLL
ncbi:MAG TPA: NAD(P)H-dependent oxidoreductase [Thermodesulfovibrionales bacterium]|nr:NAD(P)H-dependent oxidoreductase [Thermodesulfovibrionales bacterium]